MDSESSLKRLNVNNNNITKIAKRIFGSELAYLDISDNKLANFNNLNTAFPSLEVLHAKSNEIMLMEGLRSLSHCNNLVELSITGNPLYFSGIEETIKNRFGNIEVLDGTELDLETATQKEINVIMKNLKQRDDFVAINNINEKIDSEISDYENNQEVLGSKIDMNAEFHDKDEELRYFYSNYDKAFKDKLTEIMAEIKSFTKSNDQESNNDQNIKEEDNQMVTTNEINVEQHIKRNIPHVSTSNSEDKPQEQLTAKVVSKPSSTNSLFRIKQASKAANQFKKIVNSTLTLKNPRLLRLQTEALKAQLNVNNN